MRKKIITFLAYFPVFLIIGQLLCNLIWFFDKNYFGYGFYLNMVFGTNLGFALFIAGLTHVIKYCKISQACAWAQVAYAGNYTIVQMDNAYNVFFQLGVGLVALMATFWRYIKKFPLCRLSLFAGFVGSIIKKGSCKKGLEDWERNVKSIILKQHREQRNH